MSILETFFRKENKSYYYSKIGHMEVNSMQRLQCIDGGIVLGFTV